MRLAAAAARESAGERGTGEEGSGGGPGILPARRGVLRFTRCQESGPATRGRVCVSRRDAAGNRRGICTVLLWMSCGCVHVYVKCCVWLPCRSPSSLSERSSLTLHNERVKPQTTGTRFQFCKKSVDLKRREL